MNYFKSLFFNNKTFKQIIFKNIFWLGVAEIAQKGTGFLVIVWIARYFGPGTYGQWAFALNFAWLFYFFADFGFSNLLVREIARDKNKTPQYIDNMLAMKLVLGCVTCGLIVLIIQFLGKGPEVRRLVYLLGLYTVINTFTVFFNSIFRANEQMQYETFCRVGQSLSLAALTAFVILNDLDILNICYAYIGAALIGILFSLAFIWKYFSKFFFKIDFKICKEILKEVWPFGLTFMFISGYYHVDSVMLSVMKSDTAVGLYNAAYGVLIFLLVIPSLLQVVFFPRMSHSYIVSKDRFKTAYDRFLEGILTISVPICVGMTLLSGRVVQFVYGAEFEPSILILKILVWSFLFASIGGVFGYVLISSNRQVIFMKITGMALGANAVLNFLMIPKFSYFGASVATNLTRFIVIVIEFLFLLKIVGLRGRKFLRIGLKIVFASGLMGIFIMFLRDINLFVVILLSVIVYFSSLYIVKGIEI